MHLTLWQSQIHIKTDCFHKYLKMYIFDMFEAW